MKCNDMYTLAAICVAEKTVTIAKHYLANRKEKRTTPKVRQTYKINEIEKRL